MVVRPGRIVRIHSGAGKSDKNDLYLDAPGHVGHARDRGAAQRQVGAAGPVALLSRRQRRPRATAPTRRNRGDEGEAVMHGRTGLVLGCTLALMMAGAPASALAGAGSAAKPPRQNGALQLVREMPTRELGVKRPATLSWDGRRHVLHVRQGQRVVRLATDGTKRGKTLTRQAAPRPFGSTAVDAWTYRSGVLFGLASGALLRFVEGDADAHAHPGGRRSRPAGADRVAGHAPALDLRPGPQTPARGDEDGPGGQVPRRHGSSASATSPASPWHPRPTAPTPVRSGTCTSPTQVSGPPWAASWRPHWPPRRPRRWLSPGRLFARCPPRRSRHPARTPRASPTCRAATGSSSPTGRSTRCRSSRAATCSPPPARAA